MRDRKQTARRVPAHGWMGSGAVLGCLASLIRRMSGMPDYQAHVTHLRSSHPERAVPTEREFYDDYLRSRYGDGPTRCC